MATHTIGLLDLVPDLERGVSSYNENFGNTEQIKYIGTELDHESTEANIQFLLDNYRKDFDFLKKYGIEMEGLKMFYPKAYNFSDDNIDITLEVADSFCIVGLEKLIEFYINNVSQKSCSGFISFEADSLEEIDIKNTSHWYAILWSILKKENKLDLIEEIVDDLWEQEHELFEFTSYLEEDEVKEVIKNMQDFTVESARALLDIEYINESITDDIDRLLHNEEEQRQIKEQVKITCFTR